MSDWDAAELECDVVMRGGITSGVIYPPALTEFARTYRFRGVGGASAGAIGAAFAAAAEHGRASGGFDRLGQISKRLGDFGLITKFQPQKATAPLLPILLAATEHDADGETLPLGTRLRKIVGTLHRQFTLRSLLGMLAGIAVLAFALLGAIQILTQRPSVGVVIGTVIGLLLLTAAAVLVLVVGWAAVMLARLSNLLTEAVPGNLFGISTGLAEPALKESTVAPDLASEPTPEQLEEERRMGLTEWLSAQLNRLAGLTTNEPLTFGQLWGPGVTAATDPNARNVDLRMFTTCLTRERPYELPMEGRNFFFKRTDWERLFPASVLRALENAVSVPPADLSAAEKRDWAWINEQANKEGLVRFPDGRDLPVIVATRMSLSFPLLMSAVPLWAVDFRSATTQTALKAHRAKVAGDAKLVFELLWFTDGGLGTNFPISLFDAPLPTRPTFGINLGSFSQGQSESEDELENIDYATSNGDGLLPMHRKIADHGFAAISDFAVASIQTARNWQDNSYLDFLGYRDRIVTVLQTGAQGGMNLTMASPVIDRLGHRGKVAAATMVKQFTEPSASYRGASGWDNHRWVRYRALMAGLREFLSGFKSGRLRLGPFLDNPSTDPVPIDPAKPPSYALSAGGRDVADVISTELIAGADALTPARSVSALRVARSGRIRRMPQV